MRDVFDQGKEMLSLLTPHFIMLMNKLTPIQQSTMYNIAKAKGEVALEYIVKKERLSAKEAGKVIEELKNKNLIIESDGKYLLQHMMLLWFVFRYSLWKIEDREKFLIERIDEQIVNELKQLFKEVIES